MRFSPVLLLIWAGCAWGQTNRGELRFRISDPSGAALHATIELDSRANGFHESVESDDTGRASIPMLPFGVYSVTIQRSGFAPYRETVDVHSTMPLERPVTLAVAGSESIVRVTDLGPLVDMNSVSSAMHIGSQEIEERVSSLPGRSLQDLVVSQPGWLYEGNAVLHPRGSEYQTQFVVDGIPLTDNRSPSFGPEIGADDLESMSIYTAGFPAEYGRKMGGVVELDTHRKANPGLHGDLALSGGNYDTVSGYGRLQHAGKNDAFTASTSGAHTEHYLNPVVPENYTNTGTLADFAAMYERDVDQDDRIILSARRELSRFLIPNELVQQQAGQVQNGDNFETVGMVRFQRITSPKSLISLSGMVRNDAKDLDSNRNPIPIAAFHHNRFNEGYFKGTYTLHHGRQELKAGVESDATFLNEDFRYTLTDASQFDPGTPRAFAFTDSRPDLEQSAFAEDFVRMKSWTAAIGLRWDHYQLVLNRNAVSPRIAVSRGFAGNHLVLHASYDRIFQTPSSDNILLSSSAEVRAISSEFLRLPVQPSTGNDWEIGATKGFANRVRLDVSSYWRAARNFADDDQLLNTGVSYPIAFNRGAIYGAESKLQVVSAGLMSGFLSYSYMVARVWFPVTGGLFLGADAESASLPASGHFPASQDQRNTLATRWEYRAGSRVRVAAGADYGSGLPFAYGGTQADALAQYGPGVVSRLNFTRGRILPRLAINASLSLGLWRRDKVEMTLHLDGENLNNRLNVLDFGGLFSGNAIGPARSALLRWESRF
jgi:hypothetical protein